jgi:hypothetical protein
MNDIKAKMVIADVSRVGNMDVLTFIPIPKEGGYSDGGLDNDNTYAYYSPSADIKIIVNNENMVGKFVLGDRFSISFDKL